MRRRELVAALSGTTLTWQLPATAQGALSRQIGVLMSVSESDAEGQAQFAGLRQGLAELGWTDGRNLRIALRWGGSDIDQIRSLAQELVGLNVELIVSQGTPVTAALHRATRTIPIVFVVVTDPVGEGFVSTLSRPAGNITGFLTSEAGIGAKMLELLKEITPSVKRAGMLFNPDTAPRGGSYYYQDFENAAKSSSMQAIASRARSDAEIEAAMASLADVQAGLIVMPDFFMFNHVGAIIASAARYRVPAVYPWRYVVSRRDGLLSYGPDLKDIVRRGASYVDRILRGAKPADLPVQVPVKWEMAVNVKTANALGLTVSNSLRFRADEVIQ